MISNRRLYLNDQGLVTESPEVGATLLAGEGCTVPPEYRPAVTAYLERLEVEAHELNQPAETKAVDGPAETKGRITPRASGR